MATARGKGFGFAMVLVAAALVVVGGAGGCQAPGPADGALVEATVDGALVEATVDGALVEATADGAPVGVTLPGGASVDLAAARAGGEVEGGAARGGVEANLLPACSPGSPKCDPELNGLGVFVALDGRFCLQSYWPALTRFCIRSFVNGPDGVKVRLYSSADTSPSGIFEKTVKATFRPEGFALPQLNSLESITTDRGRLVIKYRRLNLGAPSSILAVTEAQLPWVWLEFGNEEGIALLHEYHLRFEPRDSKPADGPSPRDPIGRYLVSYRRDPGSPAPPTAWEPLCTSHSGAPLDASVLGGREIDSRSGEVTENGQAVTLSCVTGAIDTCLTWGYAPWAGEADDKRAALFGACLQAKRAAYYVGQGDLNSYTIPGTPILLRDYLGIHHDAINDNSHEAVWTPAGAKCFSWHNRRRPELLPNGHPIGITMGSCPPGAGLGLLSTGKATPWQGGVTD